MLGGRKKIFEGEEFYSRVDIELINEQVRLFFSSLDDVQISYNKNAFIITEYILLGIDKKEKRYPLEKTIINFKDNGKHNIITEFLFEPPNLDEVRMRHIYQYNNEIIQKIEDGRALSVLEHEDVFKMPTNYLLCSLHGYEDAVEQLRKAKKYIKNLEDKTTYVKYKEAMRVLRKVKYH